MTDGIPWSERAERAVLGAILLDNECVDRVVKVLQTEQFYSERARVLYSCFLMLRSRGEPIDTVTTCRALQDRGDLQKVGGGAEVVGLIGDAPASINVEHYADIVREYAVLRSVRDTAQWVQTQCSLGSVEDGYTEGLDRRKDRVAIAEECQRKLSEAVRPLLEGHDTEITHERMGSTFWRLAELIERAGADNPEQAPVVNTGIPQLDKLFQVPIGLMTLLAGSPGSGKSILLKQVLRYWDEVLRLKPHLVNLEDRNIHVAIRTLAEVTGIEPRRIRDIAYGTVKVEDVAKLDRQRQVLIDAAGQLTALEGSWDQSQGLTVERIAIQCRNAVRNGARALAVDIATKIKATPRTGVNKVEKLDHIIQQLAYIPQELNVPFIVTCHIKREDGRPNMHSLRGSGDWENNARGILLTHVKGKHKEVSYAHPAELIVAKATHDRTGVVEMMLDKPRQQWREKRLDEGLPEERQGRSDRGGSWYG